MAHENAAMLQRIGVATFRDRKLLRGVFYKTKPLPQPAIRTDKEAAQRGYGRRLEEGLRIEAQCFNRLLGTPEILEGVRRFNERDHPDLVR